MKRRPAGIPPQAAPAERGMNWIARLYQILLELYPPLFRAAFADEMQAVFSETLAAASQRGFLALAAVGLREFWQAPPILLRAYWFAWKKRSPVQRAANPLEERDPLPPPGPDGRSSWRQAGLEMSLFAAAGAALALLNYLPGPWSMPDGQRSLESIGVALLLLPLPALLAGLALGGLPRWAYPCAGILLGYSFLAALRYQMLPCLGLLLLAALVLAGLAAHANRGPRPLPPALRLIGRSIQADCTRLSFGFYGALPLLIVLAYDDGRLHNRTLFLAVSILAMLAGALAYARSRRPLYQVGALMAGLTLALAAAGLDQNFFNFAQLRWLLEAWTSAAALLLASPLLAAARQHWVAGRSPHRKDVRS
jgi:hypothetical protein